MAHQTAHFGDGDLGTMGEREIRPIIHRLLAEGGPQRLKGELDPRRILYLGLHSIPHLLWPLDGLAIIYKVQEEPWSVRWIDISAYKLVLSDFQVVTQQGYALRHEFSWFSGPCPDALTFRMGDIDDAIQEIDAIIAREWGCRMTFFVVTDNVSRPGYMGWDDLLKLQSEGFEIGSHSLTHAKLTTLPLANATREIIDSKTVLESHGLHINCFAFPWGLHNSTLDAIASRAYDYVRLNYSTISSGIYGVIDAAIANKTWLNINFHSINVYGNVLSDNNPIDIKLVDVFRYLNERSVPVLTESQAYYVNQAMI